MSRSSQNRRPEVNRNKGVFGITAPGSPQGGKKRGEGPNASFTNGSARAGEILGPPSMRKKPGASGSLTSRKNNDGDIFTRQSPYSRPRYRPPF